MVCYLKLNMRMPKQDTLDAYYYDYDVQFIDLSRYDDYEEDVQEVYVVGKWENIVKYLMDACPLVQTLSNLKVLVQNIQHFN